MRLGISRTLVTNTLCCAIGILGAWDAWWLLRYRHALWSLWGETLRWFTVAGLR
jgi:hypothetical protein